MEGSEFSRLLVFMTQCAAFAALGGVVGAGIEMRRLRRQIQLLESRLKIQDEAIHHIAKSK